MAEPMTIGEWLEEHDRLHPPRQKLDPDRCAEVVHLLYRDLKERLERGEA